MLQVGRIQVAISHGILVLVLNFSTGEDSLPLLVWVKIRNPDRRAVLTDDRHTEDPIAVFRLDAVSHGIFQEQCQAVGPPRHGLQNPGRKRSGEL